MFGREAQKRGSTDPARLNLLIRLKIVAGKLERPFTAQPQRFRSGGRRKKGLRFRHGILPIIDSLNCPDMRAIS